VEQSAVNTNGLAKHYDKLIPCERLPLILAASVRGDETEWRRLCRSAPRETYVVPDYFWTAQSFRELSDFHFMELLDRVAAYHLALGLADTPEPGEGDGPLGKALFFGWTIRVLLAGWRTFCGELGMDPQACWSPLPGYEMLRGAERLAESTAFTAEEAATFLQRTGVKDPVLPTAEGTAADLRRRFDARIAWWEGGGALGPNAPRPGR
jgi:hypothetical protein